ncbi:MAG: inorganic phosphate transporter [Streptosporangiales bacterium]
MTVLLVVLAVAFAWSMGAHYTGACMGMPHALGAVTAWRALLIMAPLTLLGAALASHGVADTVGHGLLDGAGLGVAGQLVVLAVAFGMTTTFNRLRVPTSTIQILVFAVVGAAVGAGTGVRWSTIAALAGIWVTAPLIAAGLGYLLTRAFDLIPSLRPVSGRVDLPDAPARGAPPESGSTAEVPAVPVTVARAGMPVFSFGLVAVGAIASFAMGANDVANATGSLVGTRTLSPVVAGLVGGAGLALGVLTWGRPLLTKVAFDIVRVDRAMASAAQLVQGVVVLVAVAFGYFTSMNQALVGAMVGAGVARGRRTVNRSSITSILWGWLIGPASGFLAAYLLALLVAAATSGHTLKGPGR